MNLPRRFRLCAIPPDGVTVSGKFAPGLGGAFLAELAWAERIRVDEERVVIIDPAPTDDELVDEVLAGLADPDHAETPPSRMVGSIGLVQAPKVHRGAIDEGLVTEEKGAKRRLWFDRPNWLKPTAAGEEPRARLRFILLGEREPDVRDAALVGLVLACDMVAINVVGEDSAAATKRAEAIAADAAIPEQVRASIRGAQVAAAGILPSEHG